MRDLEYIELNNSKIFILPVIRGLISEERVVLEAFEKTSPDVVAISISKEELGGLKEVRGDEEYELNAVEMVYAKRLSEFGEVSLPPPCFLITLRVCEEENIPIIPLDMNEEIYSETYCCTVGTLDLLRESFLSKRMDRIKFDLCSPKRFILDWDERVNGTKGFRELQRRREEHMARVIEGLSRHYQNILCVVELERCDGLISSLESRVATDRKEFI